MTGGGFYVVSFVSCSPHAIMSLNSLESEGLRAPAFPAFCTMSTSSQLGPATRLRAKWLCCQKGGAMLSVIS